MRGSCVCLAVLLWAASAGAAGPVEVEGQPLGANLARLKSALDFLGSPLPVDAAKALADAAEKRDAAKLQEAVDPLVLAEVTVNPESRVKVARGPAKATLQQGGYVPVILKVVNEAGVTAPLRVSSPQAGPVVSGGGAGNTPADKNRFLDVDLFTAPPMTGKLSGLKAEYVLAVIHSSEAGKREATLAFDVGQGTQDLGFRGEVPVLFDVAPAVAVKVEVLDADGTPTVGRFTFRDAAGRVYPPRAKRVAPDFFFQDQVYRPSGGVVLLPPGELTMEFGRGPEYRLSKKKVTIPAAKEHDIAVRLERWVDPQSAGFWGGDHHIHAAGCGHYTSPTEGVFARDMFLHVKGEGLNVGCNLTWGPCYEFQRQFFEPGVHKLSEPKTVLKYDVEVSGFGSQALGHVCLLNLKDQAYPGSDGTKTKGWPTWTTPLMRWGKKQGAVTGYAHSANGLGVNPAALARRTLVVLDADKDGVLTPAEAAKGLLPDDFAGCDADKDGKLTEAELAKAAARVSEMLPNVAVPEMDGIGAQEICVTTSLGLCDFISAMDTKRVPEWNCWYHLMNCGYPLKASGETDFPCISGSRVGEGRVYVKLGKVDRVDFTDWCEGVRAGRSYVSDGYAHALDFRVNAGEPGDTVKLDKPGTLAVMAKVAFAAEMPLGTAKGGPLPTGKMRKVELVVNGRAVAEQEVPADDAAHDLTFRVPAERSCWVALRSYPQMHTNPVTVLVGGKPVRASRRSAEWCAEVIEQLWRAREKAVAEGEREEAGKTFRQAVGRFRELAVEAPEGS